MKMATYLDKLEDSFITKLKIFLFTKAFEGNVLDYIKDTVNNLIEDFRNFELTIDIANVYSSQYYQFEKEMDFDELNNSEHCSYCGISKTNIWEYLGKNGLLHNKRSERRGYTLEIDRISKFRIF